LNLIQNTRKNWNRLVGSPTAVPIEIRIFRSVCLIALFALAYNVIINAILHFWVDAMMNFVIIFIDIAIVCLSYYRKWQKTSMFLFIVVVYVFFIASYFSDGGISGPNNLQILLSLILVLCISPKHEQFLWMTINVLLALSLFAIEYKHPELVQNVYVDRKTKFVDIASAFAIASFLCYFSINFFRTNYDRQKQQADDRAAALIRQQEQILIKKDELRRINGEKDKLISIVAHDLRSPLSNILNHMELLNQFGLDADERKQVETDLLHVTQSTMKMLSKLLLWSKAQMNGVVVEATPLNLLATLQNPIELETSIALNKGIKIEVAIPAQTVIKADHDMLQMVIRNLVSNAIKFTPPGGKIFLEALPSASTCRINIRDTGNGIPNDQQQTLFLLHARSTYGTNNEKGIGLGLLLCKEFTEKQGGSIGFESVPGKGSTFYVEFELIH
jgi:signal transduction histidine kinase